MLRGVVVSSETRPSTLTACSILSEACNAMSTKSKDLQSMVDLLRQGATLTEYSCPACTSPLFKLKSGELWCAKCQKRVIIVKEGETPEEATKPVVMNQLESTVLAKIQEIEAKIKTENDPALLERLSTTLATLLENLEKIKRMKH